MDAFDGCLRNGRLRAGVSARESIQKEIDTGKAELKRAQACYAEGRFEESVVQGYFALFRAFRALLRHAGYVDTNLYSLTTGITRLFVEEEKLEPRLLEILRLAKDQKDLCQQGGRASRKETRLILDGADEATRAVRALMELSGYEFPEDAEPESEDA